MLDDRTRRNLVNVAPPLVHLCYMMDQEGHKFIVPDPPRDQAEQVALYAQGRESVERVNELRARAGMAAIKAKDNIIVTWTKASKHIIQDDGFAHAFDWAPIPVNYENVAAFEKMGPEFEKMAKRLGIKILWGGRGLGLKKRIDRPHIELLT